MCNSNSLTQDRFPITERGKQLVSATSDAKAELSELEKTLLAACKVALRQLEYDGDDKTAFHGAAWDALTKAIASAERSPN
jgi:hypothetical protein